MQLGLYENKIEWKKLNLSVIFLNLLQNWFELLANAVKPSQNCDCIKFHEQAEIVRDFYEKTKCHFTTFERIVIKVIASHRVYFVQHMLLASRQRVDLRRPS